MSGQAQDLDGNGRTALSGIVPGTGYVTQQFNGPTFTDPITGKLYAPSITQLAAVPSVLPAIVQKNKSVSTAGVASLTCAFSTNNAAGNSIIVSCGIGNGTTATVTDSAGNTYYNAVNGANGSTFSAQIFYATGIAAGANTITVTPSASVSVAIEIYEVSGLIAQAANLLDLSASGSGTSATATAGNIASTSSNALAFMGVAVGTAAQAVSVTSGTFWALDSTQNVGGTPSGLFTFGALSQALGGVAPVAAKATLAGSEPYAVAVAAFKPVMLQVSGTLAIAGYNYTRVTSAATTQVKTGPGILHSVCINKLGASATIELDDQTSNAAPVIAIITLPATITAITGFVLDYDVQFNTGLSVTVGTAAVDATIVWK